ncbi:MAG: response regulator [Actinomycetota bacterium]
MQRPARYAIGTVSHTADGVGSLLSRKVVRGLVAIRVLVVDDHRLVAQAITDALSHAPDIEVAGVAHDGASGIEHARKLQPDVILMDLLLPDLDGASATKAILESVPDTKIVMVTGSIDEAALIAALSAGCVGYISKERDLNELVDAVRAVAVGETLVSPDMLPVILKRLQVSAKAPQVSLTSREQELLELLSTGISTQDAAERLGVSVFTIRKHIQNLMFKLGAHSRLEAIAIGVRLGLIELE